MLLRTSLAVFTTVSSLGSVGCGTDDGILKITSPPPGARVFVSRRGEKRIRGQFGPVGGNVRTELAGESENVKYLVRLIKVARIFEQDSNAKISLSLGKLVTKEMAVLLAKALLDAGMNPC